ncbi:hypothetical protein WJX72_006873 [[Myrmecia] bisecta]|uniref:Translation initiation factor eIF2B subunit epsilon n=1 Tax=[Myrmecia] bisecta TaxID=41462 RepID=A0AAW1QR93_9CHLO
MAPRKSAAAGMEPKETLTAILLADSFTQRFLPVTVERPKVLLPLVNVPMLDYTLEWLAANEVEEVFVFCCAHADMIKEHLDECKWSSQRTFKIHVVVSTNCLSAGEAMRLLDQKDVIKSDFILISGDVVSNLKIATVLEEHRKRRQQDKNAIMTLVMKTASDAGHRRRVGDTELLVAVDSQSQRLLRYEEHDGTGKRSKAVPVDAHYFGERDVIQLRSDLIDCHIYVCAPEVLMLFSDNFDYQNIRRDFVIGVLSEEELGNKLFLHVLQHDYAARVHNLRSYDAVSRDILQRWAFPYVPDTNLLHKAGPWGESTYTYGRHHIYKERGVSVARTAAVKRDTAIGSGTTVEDGSVIDASVVGRNCRIGKNVRITGCYIHDNVTIWDGSLLISALICEGATIMPDVVIGPGAIISYKVVIGKGHHVPAYSSISLCRRVEHRASFSDDELEYAQAGQQTSPSHSGSESGRRPAAHGRPGDLPSVEVIGAADALRVGAIPEAEVEFEEHIVGRGGAGFLWGHNDPHDDAVTQFSIAPPLIASIALDEAGSDDGSVITVGDDVQDLSHIDPEVSFKREVSETFLRCVKMGFDQDLVVIELNGLKIAEDRSFADCARYVFTTMAGLCLPVPAPHSHAHSIKEEYRELYNDSAPDMATQAGRNQLLARFLAKLKQWAPLLQRFLKTEDDQVELLLTLEEFCGEEGAFEWSGERGRLFGHVFNEVCQLLYDNEVIGEDPFDAWAREKEHAEEDERVFLRKAQPFLDWLRTAETEEESEEGSEEVEKEDEESGEE